MQFDKSTRLVNLKVGTIWSIMAGAIPFVDNKLAQRKVLLFAKSNYHACNKVKDILNGYKMKHQDFEVVNIQARQDCSQIENYFQTICLTDSRAVSILLEKNKNCFHSKCACLSRVHLLAAK